jgi:hypothetical protein
MLLIGVDATIAPPSPHLLLGRLTQADVSAFVAAWPFRKNDLDGAFLSPCPTPIAPPTMAGRTASRQPPENGLIVRDTQASILPVGQLDAGEVRCAARI